MDEHTLEVVARWLRIISRVHYSYPEWMSEYCEEAVLHHLKQMRERKSKQRKCEDCKWWVFNRCDLGAIRELPLFPCNDKSCRWCFDVCGPTGKLWKSR